MAKVRQLIGVSPKWQEMTRNQLAFLATLFFLSFPLLYNLYLIDIYNVNYYVLHDTYEKIKLKLKYKNARSANSANFV